MNSSRHVYYITAHDVQKVARATIGRRLHSDELERIVERLLDKIQWLEPLEELLRHELGPAPKLRQEVRASQC
jgi:hypothetical protein